MNFDVSWIYQIVDRYSPALRRISAVTRKSKQLMGQAANTAKRYGESLKKTGTKMTSLRGVLAAAAGIAAVVFPIKKAIEFEDVMIDVQKVVDFKSKDQFQKFREGIFKTAMFLGKMPETIAQIAVEGGKLGIKPGNLNEFINLIGRTATAFDILDVEAGKSIGSIKTKLGLNIKETGLLMDAINFLADNTASTGKRAVEIVSRTVGTMKAIKMPPKLIAGWAAFADQLETSPELAASGLNMMVIRMMKIPGMMRKMLKDPDKALKDYLARFARLSPVRRSRMVFKKFGDEAGRFVLKAVGSMHLLNQTMSLVGGNDHVGSMLKELEKKLAGTQVAVNRVKSAFVVAMIAIGDALLPTIREFSPIIVGMIGKITEFAKANPEVIKMVATIALVSAGMIALTVAIGAAVFAMGLLMSPVTLIIVGVTAVVGGIALMYAKSERVREAFDKLLDALSPLWDLVKNVFGDFSADSFMEGLESLIY